jgi:hypothetical protein
MSDQYVPNIKYINMKNIFVFLKNEKFTVINSDDSKYTKHIFDHRHECGNTDDIVEVVSILRKG